MAATNRGLVPALFRTEPSEAGTDVAAIPVRIALVWILGYYGAGKLFGAFHGPGIHQTSLFMAQTAHLRPGGVFAVLAGCIELGGALALALGLVSRLAALAIVGDQVMAILTVTGSHGLVSSARAGYDLNLTLIALALVVVGIGAGRLSLDAVIARRLRSNAPGTSSAASSGGTT